MVDSYFSNDRRAGVQVSITTPDSRTVTGFAEASMLVDSSGVEAGTVANPLEVNATDTTPSPTSIATGQVTVGTAATQIVPARAARKSVIITMLGAADAFLGPLTVTTANGQLLLGTKGSSVTVASSAAVYGIVAAGTQAVSFLEVF